MPGPLTGPERRARAHAERFNAAVVSGDWAAFARGFSSDAALRFTNAPVPPAYGRDAILAAYEARPPDETLRVLDAAEDPDRPEVDVVRFAWASGDPGTMLIRWRDDLVADLEVTFG